MSIKLKSPHTILCFSNNHLSSVDIDVLDPAFASSTGTAEVPPESFYRYLIP